MSRMLSPIANVAEMGGTPKPPISPLAGEMSGRTEGGAKDRDRTVLFPAAVPSAEIAACILRI